MKPGRQDAGLGVRTQALAIGPGRILGTAPFYHARMTHANSRGIAQTRITTPLGPMTALATADGLAGLWFDDQAHHPGPLTAPQNPDHPTLQATRQWLEGYWMGHAGVKRPRSGNSVPAPCPALDLVRGAAAQRIHVQNRLGEPRRSRF